MQESHQEEVTFSCEFQVNNKIRSERVTVCVIVRVKLVFIEENTGESRVYDVTVVISK